MVVARTEITAKDDGPYLVRGDVRILDAEGREFKSDKETVALCRCGASQDKPFCDGTHSRIGFRAAERAVEREQAGR